ncbi:MAG: hypothetical protein GX442_18455 [Candidatus Riflebacteria bacterium]|nr:hypothetical protein [Candidatus Riflebacteria bacterium]
MLVWLLWRPVVWHLTPDVQAMVTTAIAAGRGGALLDRNGTVLRFFPNAQGDYQLWVPLASCSAELVQAMLAAEDRNFRHHPGFDLQAIVRAAWQNLTERRIVSGASTISQQVIRIIRPRPRTLGTKLSELLLAAKLEMQTGKDDILEAYLNLAPMYGNLRGVGMGARVLFRKGVGDLALAEAATLAAFPQAPARLHPDIPRRRKALLARRDWILRQMESLGMIASEACRAAIAGPMAMHGRRLPFRAPHFVDWVVSRLGTPTAELTTSLDMTVQDRLTAELTAHRDRLFRSGARQAAGLVLDTATLEVLAMAGSFEYGPVADGFNNGCLALRSGGSTLKPFLYALALEEGFHPAAIIPDTKRTFRTPQGDYLPFNATRRAYGPVSIRSALGNSLNISAVRMLNEIGLRPFHRFLADFGLVPDSDRLWEFYGLGLAIGNPEVRLTDVAAAYGAFAHGGRRIDLRITPGPASMGRQLMAETTAWSVLDMLSDPSARLLTFGNPRFFAFESPVALKTGTSTNYRDCWLFAVTPAFVIGLWAGNFDGAPTFQLGGATAGGPILQGLLRELAAPGGGWFPRPPGLESTRVCSTSGLAPTPFCPMVSREWIDRRRLPLEGCTFHERQGEFHDLPAEYADWIQARAHTVRVDPFRLEGRLAVANPLAALPADPWAEPGVRLRPLPAPATTMPSLAGPAAAPPASIGSPASDPAPASTPLLPAPLPPLPVVGPATNPTGMNSASCARTTTPGVSSAAASGDPSAVPPGAAAPTSGPPPGTAARSLVMTLDSQAGEPGWGRLRIVSPHDGDRFVLVPEGDNLVRLRAVPENALPEIVWLVDGAEIARTPPPYEAYWQLQRGRHAITALSLGEEAAQITILVE